MSSDTLPPGAGAPVIPWNDAKLAGVLTAAVYERFTNWAGPGPFTFSSGGRDETYELLDSDPDDDLLTFERKADGARFQVEFWVSVSAVERGEVPS